VLGDTARHLADHYPVETWRPRQSVGATLFYPDPRRGETYEILPIGARRVDGMRHRVVSRVLSRVLQASRMAALWRAYRRLEDHTGQALVEYSMIICLVVVVLIIIVMLIGNQAQNMYCNISGGIGA
jgi:Flp pilus assembly pilin Flp